jgi:hypothetical protein
MWFWIKQFFSHRAFHIKAAEEALFVSIVSLIPLLLLPFITSLKAPADIPFDFWSAIWSAVASGQLYLYSFSLFGTIMWLCVEDVSSKEFPPRKYFALGGIGTAFLCLVVYGTDPGLSRPLNPVLIKASIYIYGAYLVMFYALLVFKMLRAPGVDETLSAGADRLIRNSQNRTGADL